MHTDNNFFSLLSEPHHDGSALYVSTQQPSVGETVELKLRVPHVRTTSEVWIRTIRDGEPVMHQGQVLSHDAIATWWSVRLPVHNPITRYRWKLLGPDRWITQLGTVYHDPSDAHDFRLVAYAAPPSWAADAVFYQIFPDRFARSEAANQWQEFPEWAIYSAWDDPTIETMPHALTQMYGGDFDGASARVDHLKQLGVNAVYSTPFFPGRSNHRYDSSTFDHVDPLLGGDEALARFIRVLHDHGIRFVGDLTTNHSGVSHEWFTRAAADANSVEASFYSFDRHPHEYETWLGVTTLPKLNHASEQLQDRFFETSGSVVRRYLEEPFSMDGWRVDVANMTGRSGTQDINHDVGRRLRSVMQTVNPDAFLVAEHCHDASRDLDGDAWYSTMNYAGFTNPLTSWLGSWFPQELPPAPPRMTSRAGESVRRTIDEFAASISWRSRSYNLNLLGSHDTPRFRAVVEGNQALHEVGVGLLMTFPGVPSVFQGDEFGMEAQHSHGTRSPIQWRNNGSYTYDFYRRFIGLRNDHRVLRHGGFRWVAVSADSLSFLREDDDSTVLVRANRRLLSLNPCEVYDPMVIRALVDDGFDIDRVEDLLGNRTGTLQSALASSPALSVVKLRRL